VLIGIAPVGSYPAASFVRALLYRRMPKNTFGECYTTDSYNYSPEKEGRLKDRIAAFNATNAKVGGRRFLSKG
jgi:hypothetical protein